MDKQKNKHRTLLIGSQRYIFYTIAVIHACFLIHTILKIKKSSIFRQYLLNPFWLDWKFVRHLINWVHLL